jgi:hypothetical protein
VIESVVLQDFDRGRIVMRLNALFCLRLDGCIKSAFLCKCVCA